MDSHRRIPANLAAAYLALGDINGKYQFRHKANYEAEVLVANLFGKSNRNARPIIQRFPGPFLHIPRLAMSG